MDERNDYNSIPMQLNKTTVEWLEEQYNLGNGFERILTKSDFEKAKEMEKQQLINAFVECWKANMPDGCECKLSAEQYYNETYENTNGTSIS